MRKIILVLMTSLFLFACEEVTTTSQQYQSILINAETGKSMMDNNPDIILVDVRTESEYLTYHIANSILLPVDDISSDAATVIPDKTKIYIIYCNSGNRSATAATLLTNLGYPFIYDMGGIIDWPYGTVSGE